MVIRRALPKAATASRRDTTAAAIADWLENELKNYPPFSDVHPWARKRIEDIRKGAWTSDIQVGDRFAFEYPDEPQFNVELTITKICGPKDDDLVFFEDRTHCKRKILLSRSKS